MKLIHFTADWCNPCKKIKPIIEQFIAENPDIEHKVIDVDKNMPAAMEYSIKSIPTLIFESDEKVVGRHSGAITYEQLYDLYTSSI